MNLLNQELREWLISLHYIYNKCNEFSDFLFTSTNILCGNVCVWFSEKTSVHKNKLSSEGHILLRNIWGLKTNHKNELKNCILDYFCEELPHKCLSNTVKLQERYYILGGGM